PLGQAARCPRTHPHSPGRPDRSGPTVRWPAATGVLRDARNPHRIVKILWCGARGTRFIGDSQGFLTRQIAKMPDFSVFYPLMKKSKNHSAKGCAAGRSIALAALAPVADSLADDFSRLEGRWPLQRIIRHYGPRSGARSGDRSDQQQDREG